MEIKCKPYSEFTVESGTQLKTVYICSAAAAAAATPTRPTSPNWPCCSAYFKNQEFQTNHWSLVTTNAKFSLTSSMNSQNQKNLPDFFKLWMSALLDFLDLQESRSLWILLTTKTQSTLWTYLTSWTSQTSQDLIKTHHCDCELLSFVFSKLLKPSSSVSMATVLGNSGWTVICVTPLEVRKSLRRVLTLI